MSVDKFSSKNHATQANRSPGSPAWGRACGYRQDAKSLRNARATQGGTFVRRNKNAVSVCVEEKRRDTLRAQQNSV